MLTTKTDIMKSKYLEKKDGPVTFWYITEKKT